MLNDLSTLANWPINLIQYNFVCRLKKELVMEIQQELLVSKSVVDLYNETSIVNFVGIYIESEDKVRFLTSLITS